VRQELLVTDFTRMRGGHVCLAGYDRQGRCVRPAEPRLHEDLAKRDGRFFVYPAAVVEVDLLAPRPQPPHTEDYVYDLFSLRFVRQARPREFGDTLKRGLADSVAAIFEQPVQNDEGFYIADGQGPRSLGTVEPREIILASYGPSRRDEAWDYRLHFVDQAGTAYRLKITDLTWHHYCHSLRGPDRQPAEIAAHLTHLLKSRRVLLRIGLSRGWAERKGRCYLQINGVYTSPDYLGGRTLPDLSEQTAAPITVDR
jgi:hypothetical protein